MYNSNTALIITDQYETSMNKTKPIVQGRPGTSWYLDAAMHREYFIGEMPNPKGKYILCLILMAMLFRSCLNCNWNVRLFASAFMFL